MSLINQNKRWLIKPPQGAQVNWYNPLTQGLVFCAIPDFNHPNDLVTPNSQVTLLTSNDYTGITRLGQGIKSTSTTTGGFYYPWTSSMNNLANQVTLLIWLIPSAIAAYGTLIGIPYANGTYVAPFVCAALQQNSTTTSGYADTGIAGVQRYAISSTGYIQTTDSLTCYSCTIDSSGGGVKFYRNGILWNSTTLSGTGSITWSGKQPVTLLNQSNSVTGGGVSGIVPMAAIWSRILSASEMEQVFVDPFCLINTPSIGKQYFIPSGIIFQQQQLSMLGCGF